MTRLSRGLQMTISAALVAGTAALAPRVQTQGPRPAPPRPSVGPERPFVLPSRVERTLGNGLTIVVVRKPTVPKVSIVLTVRSGLAADPPTLPGVAALTADAMQEGTAKRDSRTIRQEAFGMGASLGAVARQDYTSVTLRGLSRFLPGLLDLLSDVVINPTFPEQEVAIVRARRLQQLQQETADPEIVSERAFHRALFGEHPYSRVAPTTGSLQIIDRAKLAEFHAVHYRPSNAFLLVVGDVNPDDVVRAAEPSFGAWTGRPVPKVDVPEPPAVSGRRLIFVQRPNSIQSSISLGNLSVKRADPAWFDLLVANTIYGGAFNSRIVRNIREDKGYTYSPSSQFGALAHTGYYRFAASVRNEVTAATLKEVFLEIDKLRAEGADGQELDGVKQYLKGVFVIQTATQAGLNATLNNVYVFGLPPDYLETYRARISEVTPARVKNAAGVLLGSEHSIVVIVGDYPEVREQLRPFGQPTFIEPDGREVPAPGAMN